MAALDPSKLAALVDAATEILDAASVPFIAGHRAESAVSKQGNDFATEVDLAIERQVVRALTEATGIGVHGEEFGGEPIDSPLVWVLDPIDGTFNYAAGSPMAAILLGLLADGEPVAGLTWLPFTGQRYSALAGGPVRDNGTELPALGSPTLTDSIIGIQTFNIDSAGDFPAGTGSKCCPISAGCARACACTAPPSRSGLRSGRNPGRGHQLRAPHLGSRRRCGTGPRRRRHRRRDLAGDPWTSESKSALAAAPGVHERMLELVKSAGNPEDYL